MSFELGRNGGEREEVAATQGGRRVAIYRAQEIEPLSTYCTGVSGWRTPESPAGPDTPVCAGRTLRYRGRCSSNWAENLAPNPQIRGQIGKIEGWKHERKGSNHSNREIRGPKPQETRTIERSIPRPNMGLFMKFSN